MRVIGSLITDLKSVPIKAREAESLGYDGIFSAEINNDPFLPLMPAAEHTEKLELMTSIAVAFARNPMSLANTAHDLQGYCQGRFVLGIGSQVEPHVTRRLSMPWSRPAARMAEFIRALRAIWSCWCEDAPLDFTGDFYTHTLMTPMFTPPLHGYAVPLVKLAAVGPKMTEVAAQEADGMVAHGFTSREYMRKVTLPAVERGLQSSGRARENFDICCPVIVVTGADEFRFRRNFAAVRTQLAFYASTPGYRRVLELHGWEDLQPRLNALARDNQWQKMGEEISDEFIDTFAVVCEDPAALPAKLAKRCAGLIDSWQCTVDLEEFELQAKMIAAVRRQG